jgi:putative DNA methylase
MAFRETITRRNLPHWFVPGAWHFVTYRLAGTIPVAVLHELRQSREQRWLEEKKAGSATPPFRERLHKQFFAAYDQYLDHTCKIDWLTNPKVAAMIRGNLYHHNSVKYDLLAYCIMPNHVHVLLRVRENAVDDSAQASPQARLQASPQARLLAATAEEEGECIPDEVVDGKGPLAGIMHSLKSYTANEANTLLGRNGQFWQHESFDHWVRDGQELERIVFYIIWNPVKAKLVDKPHQWNFGSAHDRFLHDGSEEGFLLLPE